MFNFSFHNVKIAKAKSTDQVVVSGEVSNNGTRDYNTVAIRIILFNKNIVLTNFVFTVNGLLSGSTKAFEKVVEDLSYYHVGRDMSRYEIYTESCY